MQVDLFDFDLPPRFIAQRPMVPRDAARLLAVGEDMRDLAINDLPMLLEPGDLLVFNDTQVIPSRLKGKRGQAAVEATLHKREGRGVWRAFVRPARKLKPGDAVDFAPGLSARVAGKGEGGEAVLDFQMDDEALSAALARNGAMPLPPYIKRKSLADKQDRLDYQPMFARNKGAVAAPAAGLHFTGRLMEKLAARGIDHAFLTLHAGAGTFLPVRAERTEDHLMHEEHGEITMEAAAAMNETRRQGGRVVAVGSTSLRLIETAASEGGEIAPFRGETAIFITPGYRFKATDLLLTNFHLPRSTLFMLACAFAGLSRMKDAYAHAMNQGYRFYSYGDCCLLERGTISNERP